MSQNVHSHLQKSAKPLVAIVAIAMIAIAGAYVYLSQTRAPPLGIVSSSSASQTGSSQSVPLHNVVNQFFQDFQDRNINGLASFYYTGAIIIWSGDAPGLTGAYAGTDSILILYGSTVGKITHVTTTIGDYSENDLSPISANVTLTLTLNGTSTVAGRLNGTINVSQAWAFSGGQWEIVKEHWIYQSFYVEFPSSSTTFPQWGVLKDGRNPNLVSEKSFEWNVAPFVAAGIYAFLSGIVFLCATRVWSGSRRR